MENKEITPPKEEMEHDQPREESGFMTLHEFVRRRTGERAEELKLAEESEKAKDDVELGKAKKNLEEIFSGSAESPREDQRVHLKRSAHKRTGRWRPEEKKPGLFERLFGRK